MLSRNMDLKANRKFQHNWTWHILRILPGQMSLVPIQAMKTQTMRIAPYLANSFFLRATKIWSFPSYPSTSATNQRRTTMMSRSILFEEKVKVISISGRSCMEVD